MEFPASKATIEARRDLADAIGSIPKHPGTNDRIIKSIEDYIDNRIIDAIDALSDRIEAEIEIRP